MFVTDGQQSWPHFKNKCSLRVIKPLTQALRCFFPFLHRTSLSIVAYTSCTTPPSIHQFVQQHSFNSLAHETRRLVASHAHVPTSLCVGVILRAHPSLHNTVCWRAARARGKATAMTRAKSYPDTHTQWCPLLVRYLT